MAIKMSATVRNARLDAIETAIGTSAVVKIRTGAPPSAITDSDSGTVLATFSLGSDWAGAAASGTKSFSSTPLSTTASADGTAAHYRVYASNGTTQHMQGTVTATGGGGDMTIDNTSVTNGQTVRITSWSITDGNA